MCKEIDNKGLCTRCGLPPHERILSRALIDDLIKNTKPFFHPNATKLGIYIPKEKIREE